VQYPQQNEQMEGLSLNGQSESLLGFVIGSFSVQNLILCFGDFRSCLLRFAVQDLKTVATRQVHQLMSEKRHRLSGHGQF
jgi:hypothetical protein